MVQPVVTSGESDQGAEDISDNTNASSSEEDDISVNRVAGGGATQYHEQDEEVEGQQQELGEDPYYDANADDEDAAYVEKHLRGSTAVQHAMQQQQQGTAGGTATVSSAAATKKIKAPNSDAVLSCPCCFLTVCMDCQQHERYSNQYRAMFVMNIEVRWDLTLVYDRGLGCLVPFQPPAPPPQPRLDYDAYQNNVVLPEPEETTGHTQASTEQKEVYYTVCCANCHTQVASLDMTDEVYHFYGCLASS